jgi:hypothetical protein
MDGIPEYLKPNFCHPIAYLLNKEMFADGFDIFRRWGGAGIRQCGENVLLAP